MTGFLLAVYVRTLLLGAGALIALGLAHRKSASILHAIAVVALAAMLTVPIASAVIPQRSIITLPMDGVRITPLQLVQGSHSGLALRSVMSPSAPPQAWPVERFALLVWAGGASVLLLRLSVGFCIFAGWVRKARPFPIDEIEATVLFAHGPSVPMTAWYGRSVILLPAAWMACPPDAQSSALRHELAHIERGDWFAQAIVATACAVFWPNPFAWILKASARRLAERAADDIVLKGGIAPSRYADDLLRIAREAGPTPELAIAMASQSDLTRRIEMILNTKTTRRPIGFGGLVLLGALATLTIVPLSAYGIRAKQNQAPAASLGKTADVMHGDRAQIVLACTIMKIVATPVGKSTELQSSSTTSGLSSASTHTTSTTTPYAVLLPTPTGSTPAGSISHPQFTIPLALTPGTVTEISEHTADVLAQEVVTNKVALSAPVVRTLSGMPATIRTTSDGRTVSLELTPTLNRDRSITIRMTYSETSADSNFSDSISYILRVKPHTAVITSLAGRPGLHAPIAFLIRPSVIEPARPITP